MARKSQKWLWVLLIVSPLLSGLLVGLISGTSVFSLDSWNTTFNDEIIYWRAVATMRTTGLPQGYVCYNEAAAAVPSFGAYNYATFVPYFLMSFLTGCGGHNMIVAANLAMMVLAWLAVVLFLKPDTRQTLLMLLFSMAHMAIARYTWSGMSEGAPCAAALILTAGSIWLIQAKPGVLRGIVQGLILVLLFYLGVIRPFNLAMALIPLIAVWCRPGKKLLPKLAGTAVLAAVCLFTLVMYYAFSEQVTDYLTERSWNLQIQSYVDMLVHGHLLTFVKDLWDHVRNGFTGETQLGLQVFFSSGFTNLYGIMGYVMLDGMLVILLGVLSFVRNLKQDRGYAFLALGISVVLLLSICANMIFYTASMNTRMILAALCSAAVIFSMSPKAEGAVVRLTAMVLGGVLIAVLGTACLALPQESDPEAHRIMAEKMEEAVAPAGEDPWENTVAVSIFKSWPMDVLFALPVRCGISYCNHETLYDSLREGTLKSRYVMTDIANIELDSLCEAAGEVIWQNDAVRLYRISREP